jgi:hypothetical protein
VDGADFCSLVINEYWVWVPSDEPSFCSQQAVVGDDTVETEVLDKFSFSEGGDWCGLFKGPSTDWCCW